MRRRLAMLRTEHRDLDAAIAALAADDSQDQLQIARLKKRKLLLKDQIAMIEDYLTPDIIAYPSAFVPGRDRAAGRGKTMVTALAPGTETAQASLHRHGRTRRPQPDDHRIAL